MRERRRRDPSSSSSAHVLEGTLFNLVSEVFPLDKVPRQIVLCDSLRSRRDERQLGPRLHVCMMMAMVECCHVMSDLMSRRNAADRARCSSLCVVRAIPARVRTLRLLGG